MAKKPTAAKATKPSRRHVRERKSIPSKAHKKKAVETPVSTRDTRFKPGQSGNPKGRPRKERSLLTHIENELDAEMQITENGKTVRLTKREALAKSMVHNALKGDHKSLLVLVRYLPPAKSEDGEENVSVRLDTVLRIMARKGHLDDNDGAEA